MVLPPLANLQFHARRACADDRARKREEEAKQVACLVVGRQLHYELVRFARAVVFGNAVVGPVGVL